MVNLTRYGRRPIPTGPLHPRGCHCQNCDRRAGAEYEATRLRTEAARDAAAKAEIRQETRKELKIAERRGVIAADVREAAQLTASLREAKARADADPKAERLRELRAQGKTMAEAFAIIESEG